MKAVLTNDNLWQSQNGYILFVVLYKDENINQLVNELKDKTNCNTLTWGDFIGRSYLKIKEEEKDKIQSIIQALLDMNHKLYLNDDSAVTIKPPMQYTWESREKVILDSLKGLEKYDMLSSITTIEYRLIERYKSEELRQFCSSHFALENEEYKHQNIIYKKLIHGEVLESPKKVLMVEEIDNLCVICTEKEANTKVYPCNHIVVCIDCSKDLAKSNNENIMGKCVYCRTDIEKIEKK